MKKNKLVLKHCPNFYKIVNFEFSEDDNVTDKLIDVYKYFIFNVDINNEEDVKKIEKIDYVINKYIDDYYFRKDMQQRLMSIKVKKGSNNFIEVIIDSVIAAFDSYEMGYTRNIYFARWI